MLSITIGRRKTPNPEGQNGSGETSRPRHNRSMRLLALGVTGLAGFALAGHCNNSNGEAKAKNVGITLIEGINIDCRVRTLGAGESAIKQERGKKIGIHAGARTTAELETLTCVDGKGVVDKLEPDGTHVLQIPAGNIRLWTRIMEDSAITLPVDNAVAQGLKGITKTVDAVTPGRISEPIDEGFSQLSQISRAHLVNTFQGKCGSAAWAITQQVMDSAYRQAARDKGEDPSKVRVEVVPDDKHPDGTPSFSGPYSLPSGYEVRATVGNGNNQQECSIAPDAVKADIVPQPSTAGPVDPSQL